ncbi:MAG: hypothetical protein QOG04_656 [Actinomycetota bacterium]|jgi:hypothetical protein|nr:hypothetical protein [Actinomycetota bacterium]
MIELAHGVGRVYESPLPVWLYGVGAAVTVLLSFVLRAVVTSGPKDRSPKVVLGERGTAILIKVLRVVSCVVLALMVLAGIIVRNRGLSLAPLLFWIVLIVGTAAVSAVVAGVWPVANPWIALERFYRFEEPEPSGAPPWWLGPLHLYGLFWFELVSGVGFEAVAIVTVLVGYTLFSFTFRARWGAAWAETDPLSILFGFAGDCAPLELADGLRYRGWLTGLDRREPISQGLFACVFILLGATTLDNVRETVGWSEFLKSARVDALSPAIVDSLALAAFAGLFLLPYAFAMLVTARSIPATGSVRAAMRLFAWSLIPIGVAYLVAHNAPLLMTNGPRLLAYLSDPFEKGWNIFGTATWFETYVPSPALVWFIEMFLIIGGHVLGVLTAHRIAARMAGTHGAAVKSQIALTALMSLFTITTLILLGQPLVAAA